MCTVLFADDNTLLFKGKSFENLMTSKNNELIKYREWTVVNRLSSTVNKAHVMIFTTKPMLYQHQFLYQKQNLSVKDECTFFDVTLENKLKFNIHIQTTKKKSADLLV